MYRHLLLGVPTLMLATSCVPHDRVHSASVGQDVPQRIDKPAVLLRKLALDVPLDLARMRRIDGPIVTPSVTAAPPFLAQTQSPDDASRAIDCLTQAVYYEARSESEDGQRAVAQVVLNRVRDRAFPASVCGVVYQGSTRRTGCQFSFTCDGSMNHPREPGAWYRARAIALAALNGAVYAPIGAATFYHADYVLPWWAASMARVGSVGAHIFYRWAGAMERALAFRQSYAGLEPSAPVRVAATMADASGDYLGEQQVGSVTIHRGLDSDAAAPIPTAGTVPAVTPRRVSLRGVSAHGVAIHRGIDAMPVYPGDEAAEPVSDDSTT